MSVITDELLCIPFLKHIAPSDLEPTAMLWAKSHLRGSQVLWQQGDTAHEIAIVLSGELSATFDNIEVGRIQMGELVGEVSAFIVGGKRSASVLASSEADVVRLPNSALRTLRRNGSLVYDTLLQQALQVLARRIRVADRQIALLTSGSVDAPTRTEPSILVRLWKTFRPGGPTSSCPDLESLLSRQPGLHAARPEVLETLMKAFKPQAVEEGEIIFLEGEQGAAGYMVAEGQVDVLRHVRGSRAELLATLRPDDQFGVNTLVESGTRTASCVASTAGWLYRMDAADFNQLQGEARIIWHENIMASLATQIRNANMSLRRAKKGLPARAAKEKTAGSGPHGKSAGQNDDPFNDLLRASGFIESLPMAGSNLEKLKVVSTEDQRRTQHPRGQK